MRGGPVRSGKFQGIAADTIHQFQKEEEFIIAVHCAFVLGLGARHRGIVELSEGG